MKQGIRGILKNLAVLTVLGILLLSACSSGGKVSSDQLELTQAAPTPTPEAKNRLTICLGEEPTSLYLYGNSSQAMWSVLEAVYDGPIDILNNTAIPVILKELPTLENGGIQLSTAPVSRGDRVANIEGDVVALQKGVKIFPAGCTSPGCAVEWDGESELSLTQMNASFSLLPGLLWSDGQPLTAEDSVFSYQVSDDPDTKVTKTMLGRTAEYVAIDGQTVKWTGIPGYLTTRPASFFWVPLPKHQLEAIPATDLNTSDLVNKTPLGWGAYRIEAWEAGSEIRLVKNENYFKAAEGLPEFDELVFKFLPTVTEADLSPLINGECDVLDPSVGIDDQIQTVREQELAGKLKSYFGVGPSWTGINFGIKPATYDAVYNPYEDRADIFGDLRVRQAFTTCIDREKIISDVMFSQSQIPAAYLPPTHPLLIPGLPVLGHDPAEGIRLLEEVGWKDLDADPSTPRTASGVERVFNDTILSVTYKVNDTPQNRQIGEIVTNSLRDCGVEVLAEYLSPAELLAAGPQGALFGRNFDLAQLSWSTGNLPSCFLFSSSEIPNEANYWLGSRYGGVNLTGFGNPDYDAACESLLTAGLDEGVFNQGNQTTQQILANELPVIPLFYNVKAIAARPDLCGLSMDTSARSALNGIENLKISEDCIP